MCAANGRSGESAMPRCAADHHNLRELPQLPRGAGVFPGALHREDERLLPGFVITANLLRLLQSAYKSTIHMGKINPSL